MKHLLTGIKLGLVYQLLLTACVLFFFWVNKQPLNAATLVDRLGAWDGAHYIHIATHGYTNVGDPANFIAFFPLYPLLIRLNPLSLISPYFSAWSISVIGSILGHGFFYAFLRSRMEKKAALRVLLLFCLSPISFYFTHVYTEGLYLALITGFLLLLTHKKYWLAALIGFLATTTRLVGIVTVIPLAIAILPAIRSWKKIPKLLPLMLIPLGFVLYLGINQVTFGNPFHYQEVLKNNWYKTTVNPFTQYLSYANHFDMRTLFDFQSDHFPTMQLDIFTTLITPVLLAAYVYLKRKKVEWGLFAWSVAQLLIIMSQSFWMSNTRYIALILPLWIYIEALVRPWKIVYILLSLVLFAWCLYSISLFTTGAWTF